MAPANAGRQVDASLDNFNYLLQLGTQEPVEYIPVDDFFDQVRSKTLGPSRRQTRLSAQHSPAPDQCMNHQGILRVPRPSLSILLSCCSTWSC